MNYKIVYDNLINSRFLIKNNRILEKQTGINYYEGHHILPKSLGGKGKSKDYKHDNIVLLTPKEHFLAHYLLTKIYTDKSVIIAFWCMCNCRNTSYTPCSRSYNNARVLFINLMKTNKGNSIKGIKPKELSMLGKTHSIDSKLKISNSVKDSWVKRSIVYLKCIHCGLTSNNSNITRYHNDNCKLNIKE